MKHLKTLALVAALTGSFGAYATPLVDDHSVKAGAAALSGSVSNAVTGPSTSVSNAVSGPSTSASTSTGSAVVDLGMETTVNAAPVAVGGTGGSIGSINVRGAERSAPGVILGKGDIPITNCRYTLGLGGSNTTGSVAGTGIPLWKDNDCAALMGLNGMETAGGFTQADRISVACKIEMNADTETCQAFARRKAAQNPPTQPVAPLLP